MPIYEYHCDTCECNFESIVIPRQSGFTEPTNCPHCQSEVIRKNITAPAIISMDGKAVLQSLPDPKPPLQELRGKNRPFCEGGYKDLPDPGKLEGKKNKDGHWNWTEKRTQVHDLSKKS